jgi:hypothetical protein
MSPSITIRRLGSWALTNIFVSDGKLRSVASGANHDALPPKSVGMKCVPAAPARSTSGAAAGRGWTENLPPNILRAHRLPLGARIAREHEGGVKGEKPTGFLTDCLLTVSDSYSALQRF